MIDSELENKIMAETETVKSRDPLYLRLALPVAIVLAAILISGSLLFVRNRQPSQLVKTDITDSSRPVDIKINKDDNTLGRKDAKATVVEFSDFQCPFCRSFWANTFPALKKDYIDTGKIRFVYKHFPLSFHPSSMISAQASECAGQEGKFWQMYDQIFKEQALKGSDTVLFSKEDLINWASKINIDSANSGRCLDSQKYLSKVQRDFDYGSGIGVDGTPTFFINGQVVMGAQPLSVFTSAIDSALTK